MPWNARPYADDSRHELLIRAVDERGQARLERHHFRVATHFSADTIELSFLARFLLMSNLSQVIAVLLVASLCVSLAPFWVLRDTRSGYRLRRLIKFMPLCDYPWQYLAPTVLEGYRTMANLEWMRRPMIAYVLVTAGGPWFVGEILKDVSQRDTLVKQYAFLTDFHNIKTGNRNMAWYSRGAFSAAMDCCRTN